MKTQDGKIYIFSGKSRSGKSARAAMLEKTLNHTAVFAWDVEAQWCEIKGFKKVTSISQLKKIVMTGAAGKYAYVCNGDLKTGFEQMCACVFHYAMFHGEKGLSLFIAEELADVTSTAKAGAEWGKLVRRGLKRGLSIFAISQRWQEADKTAIGNASEAFIFSPSNSQDAGYISKKFNIPIETVTGLQRFQYVHYVSYEPLKVDYLPFAKPNR